MYSCEACSSTENLIESGGQFCGGTWWICQRCEDEAKMFSEFMKSEEFKELINLNGINKEKYFGSKD